MLYLEGLLCGHSCSKIAREDASDTDAHVPQLLWDNMFNVGYGSNSTRLAVAAPGSGHTWTAAEMKHTIYYSDVIHTNSRVARQRILLKGSSLLSIL